MRKIHINNEEWLYRIGHGHIVIKDPTGKKILTHQCNVSGLCPDDLEHGYWKGWFKGITPSMVKDWIVKNILAQDEYIYRWGNNPKRKLLKGKHCKVIARGKMNSTLVEFNNKQREVISRNALRRAR